MMHLHSLEISRLLKGRTLTATFTEDILSGYSCVLWILAPSCKKQENQILEFLGNSKSLRLKGEKVYGEKKALISRLDVIESSAWRHSRTVWDAGATFTDFPRRFFFFFLNKGNAFFFQNFSLMSYFRRKLTQRFLWIIYKDIDFSKNREKKRKA